MGTSRSWIEYYYKMLWAGLGVHLSFGAGESIAEVLGVRVGLKCYQRGWKIFTGGGEL